MSRAVPSEWKNEDTNSIHRLEVTCDGTPCFENTWSMNSFASIGAVMVLTVGMNNDCLMKRSKMTRIVSNLEGSFSMKSMEMEFHRHSGIRSCLRSP